MKGNQVVSSIILGLELLDLGLELTIRVYGLMLGV